MSFNCEVTTKYFVYFLILSFNAALINGILSHTVHHRVGDCHSPMQSGEFDYLDLLV